MMLRSAAYHDQKNFVGGYDNSSSGGQSRDISRDRHGNHSFHEHIDDKNHGLERNQDQDKY